MFEVDRVILMVGHTNVSCNAFAFKHFSDLVVSTFDFSTYDQLSTNMHTLQWLSNGPREIYRLRQ